MLKELSFGSQCFLHCMLLNYIWIIIIETVYKGLFYDFMQIFHSLLGGCNLFNCSSH